MRILITGGSGFIGSNLARKLLKSGHEITIFDNEARGKISRLNDICGEINYIKGDIRDFDAVTKATKGIDLLAHLAYINGTEHFYNIPEIILEVALKGIVNTVQAALENKVPQFLLMSSSEVYQTPDVVPTPENILMKIPDAFNPRYSYGGGKLISELYLINYARKFFDRALIVRPHNIYGPDMGWEHVIPHFAIKASQLQKKITEGSLMPFEIQGSGLQTRAFSFIDDFVEGCDVIIKHGSHNNIYNLGTDEEITIKDLAQKVLDYFDISTEIISTLEPEGQTTRRCPDLDKARRLGFIPTVSLKEGLNRTLEWYLKELNKSDGH